MTAEPASRDQILRLERGLRENHFPCSADHEQVYPYFTERADHTYSVEQTTSGIDHPSTLINNSFWGRQRKTNTPKITTNNIFTYCYFALFDTIINSRLVLALLQRRNYYVVQDGSGEIDLDELRTVMTSLGYNPTDKQLEDMMAKVK